MDKLYRIHWRAYDSKVIEHGIAAFSKEDAQEVADKLNIRWAKKYYHWIEPVPDDEPAQS